MSCDSYNSSAKGEYFKKYQMMMLLSGSHFALRGIHVLEVERRGINHNALEEEWEEEKWEGGGVKMCTL